MTDESPMNAGRQNGKSRATLGALSPEAARVMDLQDRLSEGEGGEMTGETVLAGEVRSYFLMNGETLFEGPTQADVIQQVGEEILSLRAENARLRQALSEREKTMREWRPIETAPKDGTPILVWTQHPMDRTYASPQRAEYYTIASWCDVADEWRSIESIEEMWGVGSELTGPMFESERLECIPTHWMPLPAPPDTAEG